MSSFWSNKRVVITGGAGFLGASVAGLLWRQGCPCIRMSRDGDYDLLHPESIRSLFEEAAPNVLIHLPVRLGGAEGSRAPATFYDSYMAATHILEMGRRYGLHKVVLMGALRCDHSIVPGGEPPVDQDARASADQALLLALEHLQVQMQVYRRQFGLNAVLLLPVDLYGPGDRFDLDLPHVIPRLIRFCIDARDSGAREVLLRNEGAPTREFVYVEDAARAIVSAAEHYNGDQPLSLSAGHTICLKALAELIADETGYTGALIWEEVDLPGRPRTGPGAIAGTRPAAGWSTTSLEQGIRHTVSWFEANREMLRAVTS